MRIVAYLAEPRATFRSVMSRPLRTSFRSYWVRLVASAVAGWVLVLGLVAGALRWRRVGAALMIVLIAAAFVRWRSRPAFGTNRGLPPGPLKRTPGSLLDESHYEKLRSRHGGCFKTNFGAQRMICVADLNRSASVLSANSGKLRFPARSMNAVVPGGFIRALEGSDHENYRGLLATAFSSTVANGAPAVLAPHFRAALARTRPDENPGPVLHRAVFAGSLSLFFGLEPEAGLMGALQVHHDGFDILDRRPCTASSHRSFAGCIELLRGASVKGSLQEPCAIERLRSAGVEPYDDPRLIGNLVFLHQTTTNDTAELLLWLLKELADRPQLQEDVNAELTDHGTDGPPSSTLADRIVSETLRLHQSEYVMREVVADVSIDRWRIPAGWIFRACVREAHRDPSVFPDPQRFDPARFAYGRFSRQEYAPFGLDARSCLGERLVRAAGRALVETAVSGFRFETIADGPEEMNRNGHWGPNHRFRLRVTPR